MKIKILCATAIALVIRQAVAAESELQFNPAFLNGERANSADLAWVNAGSALPPGEYNLNVYINTQFAFTGNVTFRVAENTAGEALPCLTPAQFAALGIDSRQAKGGELPPAQRCIFLTRSFADTRFDFDQRTLTLNFTVPQSAMRALPRGYVSPESWESGIPAAWLNYVVNGANNDYRGETRTREQQLFVSLNSGANLGAWRLRDFTTWTKESNELTHVQTWLQRDIRALRAQVYAGETFTSSQVFDAVGLRGVALKTDDNMLPASLSGYAPEVRGIARSNATVTVRQNGNVIYQTSVPPGAFVLKDLYPTSSGGDLAVTIQESDGSQTQYTLPFASVPNLVRNGQVKYALGAGKYRPAGNQISPSFAQGELFLGWRYGLTFYGGAQFSDRYNGLAFGIGQNLGRFGAYSLDLTHARSQLADNQHYTGDSVRLRYSKLLNDIGTRVNFFSLRYSTAGFYTLSDTTYKGMAGGAPKQTVEDDGTVTTHYDTVYNLHMSRKAKNQLLLSQPMGEYGALSLSWDQQTYWNTSKTTQSLQFAWNATFRNLSLGISAQRSSGLYDNKKDNILALSLSVPLGNPALSTRLRFTATHADPAGTTASTGVSGYLPGQENLFYSVNQRYSAQQHYGGDAALQYEGAWGDYNLGYSYAGDSRNLSYGMSGGAVLHEDGLTLSQPLGNTNILVKAPGASHVAVLNHKGIKTDSRGYAVIPYATPYRVNQVALDVTTVGNDVELENAIANKIPTDGALVRATLTTRQGAKAMFIVRHAKDVLPFGTLVSSEDDKASGIVGDGGNVYLTGLSAEGTLHAVWGRNSAQRCTIRYALNPQNYHARTGLYSQEVICQ
ncbi:fimbria/pilus outer membrane usher protein [Enterobacter hormaechei]|uniref:fimbria/pilus outer membrane usher protein n=1 Tax=Enterobacter hormaechei TaxID=158836 RepID=UPI001BDFFE8D|nr:fimbria/pilus outer membrane usher protein [Enterobacter hormaechei]MBT1912711.1 fimbrial biogenesis outer membrane usher protein [Enterobacter hormaechei subsp. xiangfangensis]MCO8197967.1 fimbrial biogenesis outer membrane usher protein [Enterobacter hormaechei]HCM9377888.1 fimbrial biogenesis outer membrane usher protein [Enterobacter hormaechei subsp. steigerwaltii]HCM9414108.1 fimbrial biogenesis outer membrane usher protein [Enterobacter hormaechei subsp. steigerwaltii]